MRNFTLHTWKTSACDISTLSVLDNKRPSDHIVGSHIAIYTILGKSAPINWSTVHNPSFYADIISCMKDHGHISLIHEAVIHYNYCLPHMSPETESAGNLHHSFIPLQQPILTLLHLTLQLVKKHITKGSLIQWEWSLTFTLLSH